MLNKSGLDEVISHLLVFLSALGGHSSFGDGWLVALGLWERHTDDDGDCGWNPACPQGVIIPNDGVLEGQNEEGHAQNSQSYLSHRCADNH